MANTIIELRRSNVSGNVPSSLANGEIAINTYDGKLFYRGGVSNTIQTIERFQGPAGLNQEVQFNDSGVLGADSGLTYNKTTDVLTVVGGAIVGGVNVTPQIQLAFTQANSAFIAANSAGVYANGAFAKANTQDAINLTQNNSITAAFAAANAATATDTTQNNSITAAFTKANNEGGVNLTQNNSITAAFTRANNSLDANNGGTVTGTITATSFITTGSYGNILGANTIYANNFVANTGFIQFADGSKQYTANAGSGGGGGSSNSFATISNTATALVANTSNTRLTIVGESGIVVAMNSSINQITIAAQPGAQGLTVDYGFVAEPVYYALDYGTLS
jgi:hypothetical protein